jgi:hypothetical protein
MTEKLCANCKEINSGNSNFCAHCGFSEFNDVPPGLHGRLANNTEASRDPAVIISSNRIILASVLSGGLYIFYWFYITWKHISIETESTDTNHPIWHALTLFVPIYGLFRMHAHVRAINELAFRHRIMDNFAPGLAILLLILFNILNWAAIGVTNYVAVLSVAVISTALITVLMKTAQGVLNLYWEKAFPPGTLRYAGIGVGEVIIVLIGFIFWVLLFIPSSVFEKSETGF